MRGPANKHMNARGLSRETRPSTHAHDGPGPRHCLVLLTAGRTIYLGCPSRTASWNIYRHLRERTGCHRGLWTTRAHAHGRFGVTFFLDGDERTGQRRVLNGPGDWDFGGWGIFSRRWERDPGIIRGSISGDTSLSKDTKSWKYLCSETLYFARVRTDFNILTRWGFILEGQVLDSKEIFLKIPSGYFNYSMHLFKYNLIYSVKFTVFVDFVYFARKYEDLLLKKYFLPNLNSTYDNFFFL